MHTIAVAGHLCLDIAPRIGNTAKLEPGRLIQVGSLSISLGGAVANTGGALANLGLAVTPFATIGDDELGVVLLSKLATEGFASPRLAVSPRLGTSYSLVIEQPGVDRTLWHHTGANDEFDGTTIELGNHGLLHLGYPTLLPGVLKDRGRPLRELLRRARAAGVTTSIDLAVVDHDSAAGAVDWDAILTSTFSETDIASPSLDDLTSALHLDNDFSPELVDDLADRILANGVAVVAISAGPHGLRLRTASAARLRAGGAVLGPLADLWADQALTVHPHWLSDPVTTNGAGDASTAGLLFALAKGGSPAQATALATACSAAVMSGRRTTPDTVTSIDPSVTPLFLDAPAHERTINGANPAPL